MDDTDIFALGNMTNSSGAMFERRRRILDEARKMIGRGGLEAFSIRELCKRAGVATRTVYYAFGSKERLIALAIKSYFEAFDRAMKFNADPRSLEDALEQQITTTLRNQDIPHYLRAVAALYFSPTVHPDIRHVLLDIGTRVWRPWVSQMVLQRGIVKGLDVEELLIQISNLQFAKVHEWGLGELDNDAFLDQTVRGVLLLLIGATKGAPQAEIKRVFADLHKSPGYRQRLLSQARARIVILQPQELEDSARP